MKMKLLVGIVLLGCILSAGFVKTDEIPKTDKPNEDAVDNTTIHPDDTTTSEPPTTVNPDNTTTTVITTSTVPDQNTTTSTTTTAPTTTVPTTSTIPDNTTTTSTTPTPTTSTQVPSTTVAPTPEPSRSQWSTTSFIGGMVFAIGMMAIGFVAFKFYKARNERNYHTL